MLLVKQKYSTCGFLPEAYMVLAAVFLAIFSASGKSSLSANLLVFLRFLMPLLFLLCITRPNIFTMFRKNCIKSFTRAVFTVINQYTFFISVKHLNLLTATTLVNTAPFFIILISAIIARERLSLKKIISTVIGFLGVILLLQQGQEGYTFNFYFILAVVSGFCWGMSNLMLEYLRKTDSNQNCMFYYFFWGTLISGCIVFSLPSSKALSSILSNWWVILLFSISTLSFQFFTGLAYKLKSSAILSPYLYLSIFFAALIGLVLFDEKLNFALIIGAVLVVSGAILSTQSKKNP